MPGDKKRGLYGGMYIGVYPGQYYDAETGMHNNWHRYYDPEIGRYITPDPIGLAGGINPYVYTNGDPVNFIDPLGLYRSNEALRLIVPGQVLYDDSLTAWENGQYGWAAAYMGGMVAEQVLYVLTLGESMAAKSIGSCPVSGASQSISKIVNTTAKQLQRKFKHAKDFGIQGNFNPANAKRFNSTINQHLNAHGTQKIFGTLLKNVFKHGGL